MGRTPTFYCKIIIKQVVKGLMTSPTRRKPQIVVVDETEVLIEEDQNFKKESNYDFSYVKR